MEDKEKLDLPDSNNQEPNQLESKQTKRHRPWWKRLLIWLFSIIGALIILLIILTGLLYVPSIQDWITQSSISAIEKVTGYDVEIGKIRIGFPLKLKVQDVRAVDKETGMLVGDVEKLTAYVSIMPIIQGEKIPISGIQLNHAIVDYTFPNDSLYLFAEIGEFSVNNFEIDTQNMEMMAKKLKLHDASVDVHILVDTVPKETTPSEPSNLVFLLDQADLLNVSGDILILPDSTQLSTQITKGKITNAEINLKEEFYQASRINLKTFIGYLGTDIDFIPFPWIAEINATDVRYGGANDIKANVSKIYYETADGWNVSDGGVKIRKDSSNLYVNNFFIQLPQSEVSGYAHIPFNEWTPDSVGKADVNLTGRINPTELNRFVGDMEGLPDALFDLELIAKGEMEKKLDIDLALKEEQVIDLDIKANADRFFSEKHRKLTAEYSISTGEDLMSILTNFMNKGKQAEAPSWRIPEGIEINGEASYSPSFVSTNFTLTNQKGQGNLQAELNYTPKIEEYFADLQMQEFSIQSFLPNDSIGTSSASIVLNGRGTDIYSSKSNFFIDALIDSTSYKNHSLKKITILSELNQNQFFAAINSPNDAIKLTAQADATIKKNDLVGSINIFVDTIIPSEIGFDISLIESARLELRSNLRSDLKENHQFSGEVENFYITTDKNKLHPTNTYIKANTSDVAMDAEVTSGDLSLKFEAQNGLNDFSGRVKQVIDEVQKSLADSLGQINMAPWIMHYPDMNVKFSMGRNNLLQAYLDEYRIGAKSASLDLSTSTDEGLTGLGVVSYLQADTFRIDNIDLVLRQDSAFFNAVTTVHKERFRNQPPFNILFSLTSNVIRSEAYLNWLDSKDKEFVSLGLELWNKPNGDLKFGFTPDPIVLAYNTFNIAQEDYVTLPKGNTEKIDANIELTSTEGASISFKGVPSEKGHLVRAVITNLKLSQFDGIEFVPDLKGLLNLQVDWLQQPNKIDNINAHLLLDRFEFEKKEIGSFEVFADANITEKDQSILSRIDLNEKEIVKARYYNAKKIKEGQKFAVDITQLPLDKANPFLPGKYAELSGFLDGKISNYNPRLPIEEAKKRSYFGEITMQDAKLYTAVANETYEMDNRPINISDGKVKFDNYSLKANDRKMLLNGTIDIENKNHMDLRITGDDILLLNSKQTKNTMLFGTVNANANIRITGPIEAIHMRGDLSLLGNTNVTYQSQKSELENRNNYNDLVNFTYFSDTLFVAKKSEVDSLSLGGMDIRLGIHIDPATKVNAIFSQDGNNKLSVQGGGDFNLIMPPFGEMTLNGTYDIQEGNVLVNIPPISRKFDISQGSRVIWSGDVMEPKLDFKATSRIKTNVTPPGEQTRQVDFDVNIIAEDRLDRLNLRFKTEATQDLAMKNVLENMSPEEQNRQSILLLTTGRFLSNGNNTSSTSSNRGIDINSAITSLLSSQINSLAGEALDAEINLGVSDGTNEYGEGTNYSYSISKKFYNDRISLTIGGKMVTGEAANGVRQSFIDKFSLDYRLDKAGTQYLRAFHNKNYENLLDGEVTETGGGYVIRRRLHKLTDLFKFKKAKKKEFEPIGETQNDTIPTTTIPRDTLAIPKDDEMIGKIRVTPDEE